MPAGLYIHVPFCRRRCPFCDFAISTERGLEEAWLEGLLREAGLRSPAWADLEFDTVYLGGGTPSLLAPARVAAILERLRGSFRIAAGSEVTLEANPGTLPAEAYGRLLAAGVNRLSLGVQSFDDQDLVLLGRDHTVRESLEAFRFAREAGFGNISLDLIYGLPGRGAASWEAQIDRAAGLAPEHVSAYVLTFEPGTPLTRRRDLGEIAAPSEGEIEDLFLRGRARLEEAGYRQYEVSSFARDGRESRHNRKYWEGAPYLGLGPSAHSFRDGRRSFNVRGVRGYAALLAGGRDPREGEERLSAEDRRLERLFLGLRTARGVSRSDFMRELGGDPGAVDGPLVEDLRSRGLLEVDGDSLRLTPRGLLLADEIALRLASAFP